jgi:ankyrin repeat protein
LLGLGFDPDESIVTDDGALSSGMPLWFASLCGRHEMAGLLLAHGANPNAIVYACGDAFGHCLAEDEKMEALLRAHGAGLTVEQLPEGEEGRKTAKAILEGTAPASSLNVANPTRTDLAEQMLWAAGDLEIVRLCLPHITRSHDDPWWNYVLIHAGEPDKLELLLDHGVDPNVVGDGGFTLLHHLATDYPEQAHRVARARMLLEAGASLSKRDPLLESTPLGWACRWGQAELVTLYLDRGADALEADAQPWATPLTWARKRGHRTVVELLRSHGAT